MRGKEAFFNELFLFFSDGGTSVASSKSFHSADDVKDFLTSLWAKNDSDPIPEKLAEMPILLSNSFGIGGVFYDFDNDETLPCHKDEDMRKLLFAFGLPVEEFVSCFLDLNDWEDASMKDTWANAFRKGMSVAEESDFEEAGEPSREKLLEGSVLAKAVVDMLNSNRRYHLCVRLSHEDFSTWSKITSSNQGLSSVGQFSSLHLLSHEISTSPFFYSDNSKVITLCDKVSLSISSFSFDVSLAKQTSVSQLLPITEIDFCGLNKALVIREKPKKIADILKKDGNIEGVLSSLEGSGREDLGFIMEWIQCEIDDHDVLSKLDEGISLLMGKSPQEDFYIEGVPGSEPIMRGRFPVYSLMKGLYPSKGMLNLCLAAKQGRHFVDFVWDDEDISLPSKFYPGLTPLGLSFLEGNIPLAETLLSMDRVDVNVRDAQGNVASYWLSLDMVKRFLPCLLKKGADFSIRNNAGHCVPDEKGWRPEHLAMILNFGKERENFAPSKRNGL